MNGSLWESETDPAHAMARDEAVFDSTANGTTWWRVYRWTQPALTAGVFCRLKRIPPIPWARRITGGGLVLHGHDLTFSVVTDDQPSKTAYQMVGLAIVKALRHSGIGAMLKADANAKPGTSACFSEPVAGDVMVDGRKLAGYAMRRRRGRILVQGTLACSIPPDELLAIVANPDIYRCNSTALDIQSSKADVTLLFVAQLALEFTQLFPQTQNFGQLAGIEDKITEKYMPKYGNPVLEPARR